VVWCPAGVQVLLKGPRFDALPIVFKLRDPLFVGLGNPGQRADGGSVLVGDGHKLRDGVRQFADLAVVRFTRLHQELDAFVYRHLPLFYGISGYGVLALATQLNPRTPAPRAIVLP
jgi:hypothetical protein